MKLIFKHTGFFIITLLVLLGCERRREHLAKREDLKNAESSSEFIPSPQDIPKQDVRALGIDSVAPDFNLPGIDGRFYSLSDFDSSEVLVIIFTCNHCPTSQAYEDRIVKLVEDYQRQNVQIVAISPNSVKALLLEEMGYSDLGDSFDAMKIRADQKGFNFVYLYDGDNQSVSVKYGPTATPQAFVFDKERRLRYRGRLDDSEKNRFAQASDLRAAIDAVLLDVEILEPTNKAFGCSIKWSWNNAWTRKVNEDWTKMPVTLNEIDDNGLRALMNNDTERLMLVNVWATWCGPCVVEYPEFIDIHRMYIARDFEFVSISIDNMEYKKNVLSFLRDNHSSVTNYIYSGVNKYNLIGAINPEWDGSLPYTFMMEPGGKVIYKKLGATDPMELKKTIVDHPMIGRYY